MILKLYSAITYFSKFHNNPIKWEWEDGIKVNESRYIALFVVSGSIKKLFSIDYVNIYLFSIIFFNRFFPVEVCGITSHCLYRDS